MRASGSASSPEQQLRALPVLVGSLMAGVVLFAAVAVMVGPGGPLAGEGENGGGAIEPGVLLYLLGAAVVGSVGAFFALGAGAASRARKAWAERVDDEDGRARLIGVLSISTIVRAALAEAPGLLACVVVLLSGGVLPLAGAALSVALMATLLPVRSRLAKLQEAATGMRPV